MQFTDYDIECIKNAKLIIDTDLEKHYSIELFAARWILEQQKLNRNFENITASVF